MSEDLIFRLGVDTSEGDLAVAELNRKTDEVTGKWKRTRDIIHREISIAYQGISMLVTSIRIIPQLFGETIGPFESAMLSTISATVGLIYSLSLALTTTTFLAGFGVVLAASAVFLQSVNTIKLAKEMGITRDLIAAMQANIDKVAAQTRAVMVAPF